jgi:hypothetical protein
MWANSGLAITPNVNLVSNIGYGQDALHHKGADSPFANMPTFDLQRPLIHPPSVLRDLTADRLEYERLIAAYLRSHEKTLLQRIRGKLKQVTSAIPPSAAQTSR